MHRWEHEKGACPLSYPSLDALAGGEHSLLDQLPGSYPSRRWRARSQDGAEAADREDVGGPGHGTAPHSPEGLSLRSALAQLQITPDGCSADPEEDPRRPERAAGGAGYGAPGFLESPWQEPEPPSLAP